MAKSLVFQAFSAIFNESNRLSSQASSIQCRKERRKYRKNLKLVPTVRLCRIICASAGYECPSPKTLTNDEMLLKHVLETNPSLKLELRSFKRQVLNNYRQDLHYDRWCLQYGNIGNQHPDPYPYPDTADEVQRELAFRETDDYHEMGKTYFWYIHRYDERPRFAEVTTYGKCQSCGEGLKVWRNCYYCAYAHFIEECDDIYVRCLECSNQGHQLALKEVTLCWNCGGPEEKLVTTPDSNEIKTWFPDESWD